MKRSLLEHIVCPADRAPLALERADGREGEVHEGRLACGSGHRYPITGGIPRLVVSEALPAAAQQTQASFSEKWRRIPDHGIDGASRQFYVDWYLERYGFGTLEGLRAFLAGKRHVLDAGTGTGRDAVLYGEHTRGQVFALDLSDSIDFAYRHAGHLPNVHILQADLTRLPFRDGFFDYIASDQVLHHTPDTRASFAYLTEFLSAGGEIAAYVYKKKGPVREFCDDFLRSRYTGASAEECYAFARAMTRLGKALAELKAEVDIPEDIPALGIKAGRQNLQRFLYWNVFKCYWNEALDFETNVMTNFDWYHPRYAHRHTPDEVQQWCRALGLSVLHLNVIESGISVRARKSQAR